MADNNGSDVIAGERRADLLRALSYITAETTPDGACAVDGELPADAAPPFMRALMRIEAELLLHDADRVVEADEPRTPEERRADAFVALALRIADQM